MGQQKLQLQFILTSPADCSHVIKLTFPVSFIISNGTIHIWAREIISNESQPADNCNVRNRL